MKRSLVLSESTAGLNEKETSNSNMPNQYARAKMYQKGKIELRIIKIRSMILLMNFLNKI
jgi:hypothetical protein